MAINNTSKTTTLEEISVKTQSKEHPADEKKRSQYPGKEKPIKEGLAGEEKEVLEEKPIRSTSAELQRGEQDQGGSIVSEEEALKIEEKREKYGSFGLEDMKSSDGGDKADKKLFLLGVSVFVGTIIFCGLAFFLFFKTPEPQKEIVTEVKTAPAPTPVVPMLNREEWTLSVLNGTRIAGLAKKVASQLEDIGYTVKSTGNASKNDYATTQISLSVTKSASEAAAFLLDMKKELGVGTSSSELTGKLDAQIIVGTDNAE